MIKFLNLKEFYSVEQALTVVEMEIDNAAREGTSAIKVLHGYGSHGRGGVILVELRKRLADLKKKGVIKNFFGGDKWNLFDEDTLKILKADKTISQDEDLNKANPGITIIWI